MFERTRVKIDESLQLFMDHARREYRMDMVPAILYKSIREFVLREGKRIRPTLLIFSYKGYSQRKTPINPSIYYVSTCIELLHNFMLIHDDIIDRSDLRRGKPTMHRLLEKTSRTEDKEKLGQDLAIVAGDIVYAMAIDAFLSIREEPQRKEKALKYFIQTAVFTAMGEFIDTVFGMQPVAAVKEKDVLLNYSLKTARYTFDCPLVVGAILAGAPQQDVPRLAKVGLLIGQAFQIQDDIIGIYETEKNIGKSILSDIAEEKKTILVAHAFATMTPALKKKFLYHFVRPKKTALDLAAIRKIFIQSGSLSYSLGEIEERLRQAKKIFGGLSMRPQYRHLIEEALLKLFRQSQKIAAENKLPFNAEYLR